MNDEKEIKIYTHQKNFQTSFVRSNCDVVVGGAAMGVGKSFAALLMAGEPSLDPNFRMVCIRKNLADTKTGGSMTDDCQKIYKGNGVMKLSESPRFTFSNGSFIDFTHMSDQNPDKVLERVKGWQYSCIYLDEGTGYEWNTFKTIMGRNRGSGKWTGKIRITTNPKKTHWLRVFLDFWIDPLTGFTIPERDGYVRFFFLNGESVKDIVWGDTKEEVYRKCKPAIDSVLKSMNGSKKQDDKTYVTFEAVVKSCTFYSGKLTDNQALLADNPGYIGNVAAMGEKLRMANLQGNWNIDPENETESPISQTAAREVFLNDKMTNGDRWVTVDLAEEGTDNFLAIAWDGFHILDVLIQGRTTPRRNAELIAMFAKQYDVGDSHIIYDAANGKYINDYIPDAIPFISYSKTIGVYMFNFQSLKDECYDRLVKTIKEGRLSCEESVGDREYTHQKIKSEIPISTEFVEECSVVRFKTMPSGKKKLYNKKEMNAMLGKGRSMDLLDPCAMRMMPVLHINVGEELVETASARQDDDYYSPFRCNANVYTDDFWA